jgi:CheY-like chemotaxis protein
MTLSGTDVLLVGQNLHGAQTLTERLRRWGFKWQRANRIRTALDLLGSRPFDLMLSNTSLRDGTGFGFLVALADLPVTLFLCSPVENTCFWLPAMDGGKECLGLLPALRPSEFVRALVEMVRCVAAVPQAN